MFTNIPHVIKRSTLLLIVLVTHYLSLFAVSYSISGQVLDASTRQPIDFANVSLYKPKSEVPISGVTTDEQGRFRLDEIAAGMYNIVVSFLGYANESKTVELRGNKRVIDLGKIYLREDSKMLEEVEVVGQGSSMRFELDKKVFTVDQDIASAGGSVTDALSNIPSLDVDQEGNISLRNSESVEIWINGKPSGLTSDNRAQVLEQMPAASIKEIEIITNPSAKYSPEGTTGIINIVMKQDKKAGYFGSVMGRIDYCMASPWDVPPGGNVGLNLNFTKGIVTGYFNAGYNYHVSNGSTKNDRYNFLNGDTTRLLKNGSSRRNDGGLFLRAGLDFQITQRSTIGISGFGIVEAKNDKTNSGFSHSSNAPTSYELYNVIQYVNHQDEANVEELIRAYDRNQNGSAYHPGWNTMLDWQFAISKQHHLSLSGEVFSFTFDNDNTYHQRDYAVVNNVKGTFASEAIQRQITGNKMQSLQLKADYEWKPTQVSRLEAGWQTNLGMRNTSADAWNDEDKQEQLTAYFNDFDNSEQTHALYLTYGNTFWEKFAVQVGLRGEYFKRHLSSTFYNQSDELTEIQSDTSYFQLFPSVYLNYTFKNNNELQFNYTRRIDRPRGFQINPRQNFSDSTNIQYGNSSLLPQYSSALELNYLKLWNDHTLSVGLFYRYAKDVVQNIKYSDGAILRNTFINAGKRHEAGVEIVSKNKLFREYLNLMTSVNVYYNRLDRVGYTPVLNGQIKDEVVVPEENILAWSARVNLNFLITKTFTGQISGRYRSPRVEAQGKSSHNYSVDLSLRKTFLKKTLAVALNVRDIFNSRARRSETSSETFWQYSSNRWNSRMLSLTLTYNFGNSNNRKRNDRERVQDESSMDMFDESGEGEM